MNPLTYSLCQKPVLGLMMFVTSMCAFPPLFHDEPLPLQQAGARLVKAFDVPVTKPYFLDLDFIYTSPDAMRREAATGADLDEVCRWDTTKSSQPQTTALGRMVPLHVLVRDEHSGAIAIDSVFTSLCMEGWTGTGFGKIRTVARLDLAAGRYTIEVRNEANQTGFDGVRTTLSLVAGHGK
jgi:hypothetical protein